MKKYFLIVIICSLGLISWGVTGHRTIAKIAENHLTPKAKLAVHKLLGTETLADVSNYADDIRSNPQYKYTGAWHYVNVPAGYSYEQFSNEVRTMKADNVYKMVLSCEEDLKNPDMSNTKRADALKFLVHLIGDLHQPMHVSNAGDKGGNDIKITFNGFDDNLHGLWDSGLIDHEGLTYKQMATSYDNATAVEIKKWQSDNLMIWLWESYQISTILYQEAAKNPNFDREYYETHLPVLHKQIEKAGIRLAGVLNSIFDSSPNISAVK
jgi:hypothetical protein